MVPFHVGCWFVWVLFVWVLFVWVLFVWVLFVWVLINEMWLLQSKCMTIFIVHTFVGA